MKTFKIIAFTTFSFYFYNAHSQDIFSKENQKAHYPLTAKLHNKALSDLFLEVSHYDVSGNNGHGKFRYINKSEQDQDKLYYQSSPPFYSLYSRVKQLKTLTGNGDAVANPGKNFTTPDNNLVKYAVKNTVPPTTKSAKIRQLLWDLNGNGKRDCVIDKTTGNCQKNSDGLDVKEKELYVPIKTDVNTNTVLNIPQPLTSVTNNGFTVSFWYYHTALCNDTPIDIEIMDTQFFQIFLRKGRMGLTTKTDTNTYTMDPEGNDYCSANLQNKWIFYAASYRNKDEQGSVVNELRFSRYVLDVPNFSTFSNKITNSNERLSTMPMDASKIVKAPATIMGKGFAGSLFSVRFFKKFLIETKINDVIKADVSIIRRSATTNNYMIRGTSFYDFLYSGYKNVTDRFQREGYAVQFHDNQKYIVPSFFNTSYNSENGYSISFWTKIDQKIINDDEIPFDKNKDNPDIRYQFFYAKNDTDILLGAQRTKDIFGVNRYYDNKKTYRRNPIFAWLWDPGSFNDKGGCPSPPCESVGWYHVVLVYYPTLMRVYIFHPNQDGIYRRMLYFGAQSLASVNEWGLGNPEASKNIAGKFDSDETEMEGNLIKDGYSTESMSWKYRYPLGAAKYLDDFKVFAWPLSLNDVKTLHKIDKVESLSPSFDYAFKLRQ